MYIKTEITYLEDFDAWSGAVNTKKKIIEANRGDEFLEALEDAYPDGIEEGELNDLLWFEPEVCYEYAGLNSYGVEPADAGDVASYLCSEIESLVEEYNSDNDTELTADELGISWSDFETDIEDWLELWQEDETDPETLCESWLDSEGRDMIREMISDCAPDIPEPGDHDHGDDC